MPVQFTFAIGDVHGCHRALEDILRQCRIYARHDAYRFVFIGDYVDRGPDSRAVIATLRELERQRAPGGVVCLAGNHEEMMLDAIDTGDPGWWMSNGAAETLSSYGIDEPRHLPLGDVAWVRRLRLSFDDGRRRFVHAGVDPERPLDEQTRETLLWIREPFLHSHKDFGRLIVHGHTPSRTGSPEIRPNRINLDTACVYGGVLTAAVFTDDQAQPIALLSASEG